MLPEHQSRLVIVLVRARNPLNIGAVARAMHDFGFTQLRVVSDYPVALAAALSTEDAGKTPAEKAAVHSASVLASATQHSTVASAVADCTLVLGTTAVGARRLDHPLHTLASATPLIHTALSAPSSKVALLFGSEKTGLSNDELSLCHALLTIPMNPLAGRHLSMNLGQAAAVCLYALSENVRVPHLAQPHRARWDERPSGAPDLASGMSDVNPLDPLDPPAPSADLDRLTTLLHDVLDRSGYAHRHPANVRPNALNRLVRRMANSSSDAAVWSGILRQLLHSLNSTADRRA